MKKIVLLTLCAVMVLSFASCSNDKPETEEDPQTQAGSVGIANPWVNCVTISDAEELAGFTLSIPSDMPSGYTQKTIETVENEMIQVIFESGDDTLLIRKAKGNEDISGDYNEYSENKTLTVVGMRVSTKGNNGRVNAATWVDGDYTYAVSTGAGIDPADLSNMISGIR